MVEKSAATSFTVFIKTLTIVVLPLPREQHLPLEPFQAGYLWLTIYSFLFITCGVPLDLVYVAPTYQLYITNEKKILATHL